MRVIAPSDQIGDEILDALLGLVRRGASAAEGDANLHAGNEAPGIVGGVLGDEGLASGEALVGVVGDGEISLAGELDGVAGVVLVEGAVGGAGARCGGQDQVVGGDLGGGGGGSVEAGDGGGAGVEEGGDLGGGLEGGGLRAEDEVGLAGRGGVAGVAKGGGGVGGVAGEL